jgi:D-beta-D-heptose 7-phosphate kinase / D-beta-D-heptose 1-phosphate adenosyltransferase
MQALDERILSREAAVQLCETWRAASKRIVFTNGCFDILHPGHVRLLESARRQGDVLVVGLNEDASIRRLKGPERPIVNFGDRAIVLAGLRAVDVVVGFAEDTPFELIRALRPHVLVKGGDYQPAAIVGADLVRGWGGEVQVVALVEGKATTALVTKIRSAG